MAGSNKSGRGSPYPGKTIPGDKGAGQVRIIAGRWRGRMLAVPNVEGLRPTGDRVRETLFNWLQTHVAGAHCLDLFAGSGALGFEALSRHAASVTFVESNAGVCQAIEKTCKLLDVMVAQPEAGADGFVRLIQPGTGDGATPECDSVSGADSTTAVDGTVNDGVNVGLRSERPTAFIHSGSAQSAIERWATSLDRPAFDLLFIDPPFESACQWEILQAVVPLLRVEDALIYVECPTGQAFANEMPGGCKLVREKRFGHVIARLLRYTGVA